MAHLIDKSALVAEIERRKKELIELSNTFENRWACGSLDNILSFLDTLEVKEIEDSIIPKHSYFESIYHCGSEPRWKIGDVLAVYEFYSDYEGEHVYGKITDVKMDEDEEDWCYTFENGDVLYENMLISDEAYKKN